MRPAHVIVRPDIRARARAIIARVMPAPHAPATPMGVRQSRAAYYQKRYVPVTVDRRRRRCQRCHRRAYVDQYAPYCSRSCQRWLKLKKPLAGAALVMVTLMLAGCVTPDRPWLAITRSCQPDVARCERGTTIRAFKSKSACYTVMSALYDAPRSRRALTDPACIEVDTGAGDVFVPDGKPAAPLGGKP